MKIYLIKKHPCYECKNDFFHYHLWDSGYVTCITVSAIDPEDSNKYHRICYECEARYRYYDEQDKATKDYWDSAEGWSSLVADVKKEMAESKRQKHARRGGAQHSPFSTTFGGIISKNASPPLKCVLSFCSSYNS